MPEVSAPERVSLVVSDVDGTLLNERRALTPRTVAVVGELRARGIRFAVASSRPPRGLRLLFDPLAIDTPVAAFNGGLLVDTELRILLRRALPGRVARRVVERVEALGIETWIYADCDWFVHDATTPHARKEIGAVGFEPEVVESFDPLPGPVAKIVAVSDDDVAMSALEAEIRGTFGDALSATRSHSYYLDMTDPAATKGHVIEHHARAYRIPREEIVAIGDGANDVLMFRASGFGIAMGNAAEEVKAAAAAVTRPNTEDGFAEAVERFVLSAAPGDAARREG